MDNTQITITGNNSQLKVLDLDFNRLIKEFNLFIQVKQATRDTYNKGLQAFWCYIQTKALTNISRADLLNYIEYLKGKDLKPTTIKSYIASIKAFYKFLEIQYNFKDIAKSIKTPAISKSFKKDALTVSQTKDLINNTNDLRDKIIILLGVSCGLRTVEISRLDKSDLQIKGNKPILWVLGKARDEKEFIVLPDSLYSLILEYLETRQDNKDALLIGVSNRSCDRLNTGSISRIIKTHLRNNNINSSRITAHSLRHTAITLSLLSGNSLRETQELARHKNINTTLIYAHDLDKLNNKCSNNILDLIGA